METTLIKKKRSFSVQTKAQKKPSPKEILLFEELKSIAIGIERFGNTDSVIENKIESIFQAFKEFEDSKGTSFSKKTESLLHQKRAIQSDDLQVKRNHYTLAIDAIDEAIFLAKDSGQPSLRKHLAVIEAEQSEVFRMLKDHHKANIIEAESLKIFAKLLYENPDYPEAYLEAATALFRKLKWSISKIYFQLGRAEELFIHPKYTKQVPDSKELEYYQARIKEMKNTVNQIISIIQ